MKIDAISQALITVAEEDILPRFRNLKEHEIIFKEPGDFVTEADLAAEESIIKALKSLYRKSIVTGEEELVTSPHKLDELVQAKLGFLIDPIDGTNNYIKGDDRFAVMVVALRYGVAIASWIYLPYQNKMAVCEKGSGAYINGKKIIQKAPPTDIAGNVVRNVSAPNKKGVNRVAWGLRHSPKTAITDDKSGVGGRRPSGAFAVPGMYSATLNSRVNGMTTELAGPVNFDVVRITEQAMQGVSVADATAFQLKVEGIGAEIAAANTTVSDLMDKLKLYRMAIDRANGSSALEGQYEVIRAELYAIDEAINGERTRAGKGARPATISSRVSFAARSGSSTYGPTKQSVQQLGYASDAFGDVKARVKTMIGSTIPALEKAMNDAGAPWVRGGDLK